jgi:hypothetical protein
MMNNYRISLVLFATTALIAVVLAVVTTLVRIDIRHANNALQPTTVGAARPQLRLDRAPGEPPRLPETP